MKKNLLFIFLLFGLSNKSFSQSNYFVKYRPLVDSLSNAYKIPSSVILAVAYLESGGGTSVVGRRLNNHFGLKGRVPGGDTVNVKSSYKYFPTATDSYIYFCELVARKKFYPSLKGSKDYKKWVVSIANTGYAASATVWSKHVLGIIEKYKLEK